MSDTCKQAHQIVSDVQSAYRGLATRLAGMTGKTPEAFSQHGREPKSLNPLQTGSPSPVTHFMQYCRLYEGGEPSSGRMLSDRVHAALSAEFAENDLLNVTQNDLHISIIDEVADVKKQLLKIDLNNATRNELLGFETECDEAVEAIMQAKSRARVIRATRSVERLDRSK